MNPGVQANIIALVLCILVLTGWGSKTVQDAKLTPRLIAIGLFLFVLTDGYTVSFPYDLHVDLAGVILPLLVMMKAMILGPHAGARAQWWIGCLTVASVTIVLMTLVPLDPAFFPLEGPMLFPVAAALVSVVSVRRPFAAVSIAITGLALGALVDPWLHTRADLHTYVFGGREVQDWMALAALCVLMTHGIYQAMARLVYTRIKQRLQRREEGPEHV